MPLIKGRNYDLHTGRGLGPTLAPVPSDLGCPRRGELGVESGTGTFGYSTIMSRFPPNACPTWRRPGSVAQPGSAMSSGGYRAGSGRRGRIPPIHAPGHAGQRRHAVASDPGGSSICNRKPVPLSSIDNPAQRRCTVSSDIRRWNRDHRNGPGHFRGTSPSKGEYQQLFVLSCPPASSEASALNRPPRRPTPKLPGPSSWHVGTSPHCDDRQDPSHSAALPSTP
jgi:hypothetical protein